MSTIVCLGSPVCSSSGRHLTISGNGSTVCVWRGGWTSLEYIGGGLWSLTLKFTWKAQQFHSSNRVVSIGDEDQEWIWWWANRGTRDFNGKRRSGENIDRERQREKESFYSDWVSVWITNFRAQSANAFLCLFYLARWEVIWGWFALPSQA